MLCRNKWNTRQEHRFIGPIFDWCKLIGQLVWFVTHKLFLSSLLSILFGVLFLRFYLFVQLKFFFHSHLNERTNKSSGHISFHVIFFSVFGSYLFGISVLLWSSSGVRLVIFDMRTFCSLLIILVWNSTRSLARNTEQINRILKLMKYSNVWIMFNEHKIWWAALEWSWSIVRCSFADLWSNHSTNSRTVNKNIKIWLRIPIGWSAKLTKNESWLLLLLFSISISMNFVCANGFCNCSIDTHKIVYCTRHHVFR